VFAEITEATLQALPGILDPGQDGYHDTSTDPGPGAPMWDPTNTGRGVLSESSIGSGGAARWLRIEVTYSL
jgi:hypothetical protein